MTISSVQAAALKGRSFSQSLKPLTVITGANDTGKTSIFDAIKLALLGYLPGHPKTNQGVFALCSGTNLRVTVNFSQVDPTSGDWHTAGNVGRSWTCKGKKVVAEESGTENLPDMPIATLDGAAYFGASDTARTAMVFEQLDLKALGFDQERMKEELLKGLKDGALAIMTKAVKPCGNENLQTWIEGVIDILDAELKLTRAELSRMEKTQQGLATLNQNREPKDAGTIQKAITHMEETIKDLERQKATLNERLQAAGQAKPDDRILELERKLEGMYSGEDLDQDRKQMVAERESAQTELQGLLRRRGEMEALIKTRKEWLEEKKTLEASLEKGPPMDGSIARAIGALEEELKTIPERDTEPSAAELKKAQAELEALRQQYTAIDEEKRKIALKFVTLARCPACPTCGSAGPEFQELIHEAEQRETADVDGRLAVMLERGTAAGEKVKSMEAMHSALVASQQHRARLEAKILVQKTRQAEQDAVMAEAISMRKQLKAMEEKLQKCPDPAAQQNDLDEQIGLMQETIQKIDAAALVLRDFEELASLKAAAAARPVHNIEAIAVERDKVSDAIEEHQNHLQGLKNEEKEAIAQAGTARQIQEAEDMKKDREAMKDTLTAKMAFLKDQKAKLVKKAFDPLLETANAFVKGIIPTPIEYQDGEIGRYEGSNWIPLRSFGGAYTAVTCAGIQAALGAQSPLKIVMVDELANIDVENRVKFLENVAEAIDEERISQFIGIDPDSQFYAECDALDALALHLVETSA